MIDLQPSLATNIIDSSLMVLGGSATVTALTGMNTIAVRCHRSSTLIDMKFLFCRLLSSFLSGWQGMS
jgi:hypothetical protein